MAAKTLADRLIRRWRWHVREPLDRHVGAPLRHLRNAHREFRPVFVAGASGSGTSLLAVSLGQRFDCAGVIYETNFQVGKDSFLYVPAPDGFASPADYQEFMTPTSGWLVEDGKADLQRCYRQYCSGRSDVVVDKGPDINLLRAAYLSRCFPEAPFVLIFRDAASNIEGLRRKWSPFRSRPLGETIRFYAEIHETFLEAAKHLAGRVHAVHYEALVADPEGILGELGRRLSLPRARRTRRLDSSPNLEGQGIRNVRRSQVGFVTDATARARGRLAPEELEAIESALGPLEKRLHDLPYAIPGCSTPGGRRD